MVFLMPHVAMKLRERRIKIEPFDTGYHNRFRATMEEKRFLLGWSPIYKGFYGFGMTPDEAEADLHEAIAERAGKTITYRPA
jgi:hypothetical protein